MKNNELPEGTRHEAKEHPDVTKGSRAIAEKIAAAHLREDSHYYTHLKRMEKQVKDKL